MASSSHGNSSQVSSGGDAVKAFSTISIDAPEPRAELRGGAGTEAAPKGVDHKRLVWIGDFSFQGGSGEEIKRWEREALSERKRKAVEVLRVLEERNRSEGRTPREEHKAREERKAREDLRKLEVLEELEADPEDPIDRIENLLWIKENTFYREALDDWKEQKNVLDAKISENQKREGEVINQIYNLIGFFSVFQGVILTAVSQITQTTQSSPTSRPLCGKVWFPALLSGLAAVAAISGIGLKFRDLYKLKWEIFKCRRDQWALDSKRIKLERDAKDFLFREAKKREWPFDDEHHILKSLAVVAGVIVFTVVLIMSYVVIMCDKLVANWH